MRRLLKIIGWLLAVLIVAVLLLLSPVAYVETFCHADPEPDSYKPLISAPEFRRQEANTYLTYPEWHIVYAYDGLAETLKTGDEYGFDYFSSVKDFWVADCALTRIADRHGGADSETRMMIATIGVSFTLEMGLKAAYEETIGRLFALWRGSEKTPQDIVARDMAIDYAAFLRQTPWYKYPFQPWIDRLWAAPVEEPLRGWERRLALGGEWRAKIAYAGMIASAVAATGEAKLTIRSVISGLPAATLQAVPDISVISETADGVLIETPRYDRFTHILAEIARVGGVIREIAGNDEIMVSLTTPSGAEQNNLPGEVITRLQRSGFDSDRLLLSVKMSDLAPLLKGRPIADPGLEHIFDF
ncbi:hypothetical protein GCM10010520_20420 [Rhizobium viscosum]|uniref:Uncharacterized protein n=1 Tax=Rhizobium viscosum TaxID=1673 RepID=A0ABR9J3R9_RHIVS|nr:hypothetical protein [Rhizobium viscosum]MBE1509707.1 hypothetical protein [Rhizobium viscosum]